MAETKGRIRILFTIPNFDTAGSGKALMQLAKRLNPELFEVHILCLHERGVFFKEVKNSGLDVHVFNYLVEARPILHMLWQCWRVSRQLKTISPDIMHSFNYNANYTEAIAAHMAGIKWVFTKKSMSWGGKSKNAWWLRSFLAKAIVVQNTKMIELFYPNRKDVFLIPRGVDTSIFSLKRSDNSIREVLQTSLKDRIIICVANFVPVKGLELLLKAFKNLSMNYTNWSLWLVGDDHNPYGQDLKAKVKSYGLADSVKFSGKQLDVRPFLDHAEIFVLPTKNEGRGEGSPVALLEAMANGKVVLGSDIPGIHDQLQPFQDFLFVPGDVHDLTMKLNNLMKQSKEDLKAMGKIFSKHVFENHDITKEVSSHELFYKQILNT